MTASASQTPAAGRSGFSLVELLLVMAIMAILVYMAIPITTSLQEANKLALAGQIVTDQLAVARQYSASRNQTVYVRFITPSASSYHGYEAIQIWATNPSLPGQYLALDFARQLPTNIEVSSNSALSPLLTTLVSGNTGIMPSGSNVAGNYVYFTVRPDGNVVVSNPPTVTSGSNAAYQMFPSYFFTILPVRYDLNSTLPKNYVMVQINPDTATTDIYRP